MGWGMRIKNVFVSRTRKADIEFKMEEHDAIIKYTEDRLRILAAMTPRDMEDEEGNKIYWLDYVLHETNEAFTELAEAHGELKLLTVAMNNIDDVIDDD